MVTIVRFLTISALFPLDQTQLSGVPSASLGLQNILIDGRVLSSPFFVMSVIAKLSNNPAVPISLKQMMNFGESLNEAKLLQAGNFVGFLVTSYRMHITRSNTNRHASIRRFLL
jgi:hypothetical protein